MRHTKETLRDRVQAGRAAVFIDFDDLVNALGEESNHMVSGSALSIELYQELRKRLQEHYCSDIVLSAAFGTFADEDERNANIAGLLYAEQVQVHYLDTIDEPDSISVRIATEVVEMALTRPDITHYVLVAGNKSNFQTAVWLRRRGLNVVVVGSNWPDSFSENGMMRFRTSDFFPDAMRRKWHNGALGDAQDDQPLTVSTKPEPETWKDVTDPAGVEALLVIEEYFGQYNEVYLTPLLRKLSEVNPYTDQDPKTVVAGLEECGAVWLEKRRGFPHDYTVLLVNRDHPSVIWAQQEYEKRMDDDSSHADKYQDEYDDDNDDDYQEESTPGTDDSTWNR